MDRANAAEIRLQIETVRVGLNNRYTLTKQAMRGAFHASLLDAMRPNVVTQQRLQARLVDIVGAAWATEREFSNNNTRNVVASADSQVTPDQIEDRLEAYQRRLLTQLKRDAASVNELLRKTQLGLASTFVPREQTLQNAILQIDGKSVFGYSDKKGRVWDSSRYLTLMSADYYYGLANDLIIGRKVSEREMLATVDRPGHKTHGMTFQVEDWMDVRGEIAHPQSKTILT